MGFRVAETPPGPRPVAVGFSGLPLSAGAALCSPSRPPPAPGGPLSPALCLPLQWLRLPLRPRTLRPRPQCHRGGARQPAGAPSARQPWADSSCPLRWRQHRQGRVEGRRAMASPLRPRWHWAGPLCARRCGRQLPRQQNRWEPMAGPPVASVHAPPCECHACLRRNGSAPDSETRPRSGRRWGGGSGFLLVVPRGQQAPRTPAAAPSSPVRDGRGERVPDAFR